MTDYSDYYTTMAAEHRLAALQELRAENDKLRATLQGIAFASYRDWEPGMNTAEDFVRWAQSRAQHAL